MGMNKKQAILTWPIIIIPAVSYKVKAGKPIDPSSGASFGYNGGSKMAEIELVTKIGHFWYLGQLQGAICMNWGALI